MDGLTVPYSTYDTSIVWSSSRHVNGTDTGTNGTRDRVITRTVYGSEPSESEMGNFFIIIVSIPRSLQSSMLDRHFSCVIPSSSNAIGTQTVVHGLVTNVVLFLSPSRVAFVLHTLTRSAPRTHGLQCMLATRSLTVVRQWNGTGWDALLLMTFLLTRMCIRMT